MCTREGSDFIPLREIKDDDSVRGWLMVKMMIMAEVCVSSARANEPNKATVQIGAI